MNRLRFIKVRRVKAPRRGNPGDAGLDFFVPIDLTVMDLDLANEKVPGMSIHTEPLQGGTIYAKVDKDDWYVDEITLAPHARLIIPSGIRILLEPEHSMLQVNNKSGISTKKGLIFTAEVIDSTYTGEIHLCVLNTTTDYVTIKRNDKLVQLIHIPVYLTEPEEITEDEFQSEANNWSSRGTGWQGSTGNK